MYRTSPIKRILSRMGNLDPSLKQRALALGMMSLFLNPAGAVDLDGFDRAPVGRLPAGWSAGVTGAGHALWSVEKDDTAPSLPNVLKQSGQGTFVWCVKDGAAIKNGVVEVTFKPVSGNEDQAGGVIWRFKVSPMQWHRLRVDFEGSRFLVYFDGRQVLAAQDEHITVAGLVGLWTKADSVTLFDNFSYVTE